MVSKCKCCDVNFHRDAASRLGWWLCADCQRSKECSYCKEWKPRNKIAFAGSEVTICRDCWDYSEGPPLIYDHPPVLDLAPVPYDIPVKDPRRDRRKLDPHAERCIYALSPHERARARRTVDRWTGGSSAPYDMSIKGHGWASHVNFDSAPMYAYAKYPRRLPSLEQTETWVPRFWPKVV